MEIKRTKTTNLKTELSSFNREQSVKNNYRKRTYFRTF